MRIVPIDFSSLSDLNLYFFNAYFYDVTLLQARTSSKLRLFTQSLPKRL